MAQVAVMGSGSFGTVLAKVFADAGGDVTLYARRPELVEAINRTRRNPDYLPDIELPVGITATADPRAALAGADIVVLAVVSQSLRENLAAWGDAIEPNATVVSVAKGIEAGTGKRMSEVIVEAAGIPADRVAVLSGPNLSGEIAVGQPTATVIACTDLGRAAAVQEACATGYFRPYTNNDVIGCEIGGAGKNVIALVCGAAAGFGLGENSTAAIITRGLAEVTRLAVAVGGNPTTLAGIAGVGDLVATCTSPRSRNRSFGERLGAGATLAEAQEATNGQVAEGVKSCASIVALAHRHGVEMPIAEAVDRVVNHGANFGVEMLGLMARSLKAE